jgi:predicted metalloprotease
MGGGRAGGLGGGGLGTVLSMLPIGRMGIGGIILVVAIYFIATQFMGGGGGGGSQAPTSGVSPGAAPAPASDRDREMVEFMSFILDDMQAVWQKKLEGRYRPAKLVLFEGSTQTACGYGQSAMGPFYCPPDEKAYIDLSFFRELDRRFGAPGDFAQAYVLAHELGHHVQHVLGIDEEVRREQARDRNRANDLSVRMELMADCLAGVWGHSTAQRKLLEPGDVEEGLRAAAAIGDDNLQKQAGGRVAPDSFTHGSSEQRGRWLRKGLETGDYKQCDTFAARDL